MEGCGTSRTGARQPGSERETPRWVHGRIVDVRSSPRKDFEVECFCKIRLPCREMADEISRGWPIQKCRRRRYSPPGTVCPPMSLQTKVSLVILLIVGV